MFGWLVALFAIVALVAFIVGRRGSFTEQPTNNNNNNEEKNNKRNEL